MCSNGSDEQLLESATAVNSVKIEALRNSFEAHREETRARLRKILTILTAIGTTIFAGLVTVIATLITLL